MDIKLFRIFNHFLHLRRIWFRIRCQTFNGQLLQIISITQISESFMSHNDIPALHICQPFPEFPIQFIKLPRILLIVCFIIIPVLRICLAKSIPNIFHLLLCPQRIQPDMRIFPVVSMSMIPLTIQKFHSIRCLSCDQILILQRSQYILSPVLQVCTVINKNIRILKITDIRSCRLPVMRLRSRRNHVFHLNLISANFLCEVVHGIKARHNLKPPVIRKRLPHSSGSVQSISNHTANDKDRCCQNCCRPDLIFIKTHYLLFLRHPSQYP